MFWISRVEEMGFKREDDLLPQWSFECVTKVFTYGALTVRVGILAGHHFDLQVEPMGSSDLPSGHIEGRDTLVEAIRQHHNAYVKTNLRCNSEDDEGRDQRGAEGPVG